jgi:hypothetical protein
LFQQSILERHFLRKYGHLKHAERMCVCGWHVEQRFELLSDAEFRREHEWWHLFLNAFDVLSAVNVHRRGALLVRVHKSLLLFAGFLAVRVFKRRSQKHIPRRHQREFPGILEESNWPITKNLVVFSWFSEGSIV